MEVTEFRVQTIRLTNAAISLARNVLNHTQRQSPEMQIHVVPIVCSTNVRAA